MKYQLVLQFEAVSMEEFDRLVALEDRLIEELRDLATVDGHDFGLGRFTQVLTRGWGPLDVELFHVYFVVLPRYLILIAGVLLIAGCVSAFAPHP